MSRFAIEITGPKGSIPFTIHRDSRREADEIAKRYRETNPSVTVTELADGSSEGVALTPDLDQDKDE